MTGQKEVAQHYTSGDLFDRLSAMMQQDGADVASATIGSLAPFDHFHGRGIEATEELADQLTISADDHILDIGCGIGGPARYMANRFGCRISGIDLTEEFCRVAVRLNEITGMQAKVQIAEANALSTQFPDASFDGAYSMNVSMNIADKSAFYREIHRLLKPRGWLALSEAAKGKGPDPTYPTPWAGTSATSFLSTRQETEQGLRDTGFTVVATHDTRAQSKAFAKRSRQAVDEGKPPPHRAISLIYGERAQEISQNMSAASAEGRVIPIVVICRKQEIPQA